MGMSASQARFLSITSRMNDIEFKSQQVANTKIRLADDSERVANDYTKALNKQKFTITRFTNTMQKVDLTLAELYKQGGFRLKASDGRLVVPASSTEAKAYKASINDYNSYYDWTTNTEENHYRNSSAVYGLMMEFGVPTFYEAIQKCGLTGDRCWTTLIDGGAITREKVDAYNEEYHNLYEQSSGTGIGNKQLDAMIIIDDSRLNDANWLFEAIESGEFIIEQGSILEGWQETSVSSNVSITQEADTKELAKAEAKYNAETAKINKKEKILDNEMKALDTEHQALKTEMDSIKSVIKDNVDKSFNLFS